jgi:hypothetical protein
LLLVDERGREMPGVGISLLLIAVGAILAFAVDYAVQGVELYTVGIILLAVGAVGLLVSLLFWSSMPWSGGPTHHDEPHAHY